MSLLARSALRDALRHPAQAVLTVLGVALGVGVALGMHLAVGSARQAFLLSTEAVAGRATHRVTGGPAGLPDGTFLRVRLDAGVRASAPVVEGWVASPALPGVALRVLGVDPLSEGPFRPWAARGEGGDVDATALLASPGAAVLAWATAAAAGVAVGDTLPLVVDGRTRPVVVAGVLEPEGALAREGLRDVVLMDVSGAQEVLGMVGRLSRIDLALPEGEAGRAALERVQAALPPGARVEAAGAREASLAGMVRSFDLNLTALSLLALVFGMFLVYNATTFSVVRRREALGVLRAVGVTRREVLGMVLAEAAALGAAGTGLGLVLGVVLSRGMVRLVTRTINDLYFVVSVRSVPVPPSALLWGAALGVGAALLATLPPAHEATSRPPRATLARSEGEERAARSVGRAAALGVLLLGAGAALLLPPGPLLVAFAGLTAVLLGIALLTPAGTRAAMAVARPLAGAVVGVLGTMAARGVVRAQSRTAPAAAALVVAVSVTVGLGVMIDSFRVSVAHWLERTLQADVYVSLPGGSVSNRAEGTLDPALVARLSTAPGVAGVSTYRNVVLPRPGGEARLIALHLDPRGDGAFDFLAGDPAEALRRFRRDEGVLVSEPFAFREGVGVGDTVRLPSDRGEVGLPVAGVFRDYGSDQGVVMMDRALYDRLHDDRGVTSLGLFVVPDADPAAVLEGLRERAGGAPQAVLIRSNRDLREASLQVFDRTFAITAVLRALAFVVAFIGVLGALMALQLERSRELAVLRANGLTPGQVWTLVTAQTGLLGLAAGLMAIPAGLVLAWIMIHVVNRRSFGWTIGMELPPGVFVQAVALALAGALLAGLYPAWRMSRTPPAAALRAE